jgi:thiamine-monophosphate kinase
MGRALGEDPVDWVLRGGDDHALLACFPSATGLPDGWRAVGSVRDGRGVTLDGVEVTDAGGHRHFG